MSVLNLTMKGAFGNRMELILIGGNHLDLLDSVLSTLAPDHFHQTANPFGPVPTPPASPRRGSKAEKKNARA